jgi:hypothetical protein
MKGDEIMPVPSGSVPVILYRGNYFSEEKWLRTRGRSFPIGCDVLIAVPSFRNVIKKMIETTQQTYQVFCAALCSNWGI